MSNTNENSLGLSFLSFVIDSITSELGRDHWLDFQEQVRRSYVPAEFFNALASVTKETGSFRIQQPKDYIPVAERIFSKRFVNSDEAMFAIHYCKAVSIVKLWEISHHNINEDYQEIHKVKRDCEKIKKLMKELQSMYSCDFYDLPDKLIAEQKLAPNEVTLFKSMPEEVEKAETALETFDTRVLAVNKLRNRAISECGVVNQLKSYRVTPKFSDFVPWIKWQIAKIIRIQASEEDLEKVRLWIEEFFEKDQNRSNVVLLSRG